MNIQKKMFLPMILVCMIVFGVMGQIPGEIDLRPTGTLFIRTPFNATRFTYNFGDFSMLGGTHGSNWGWLMTNRAHISGDMFIHGNLHTHGSVSANVKNFIHPHPTNESKIIRYTLTESGEALTLTRGSARTVNGEATVMLPEHFSMTTSPNAPVTVIVTPKNAPVLLYTKQDGKDKIVVAMRKSDLTSFGDVEFDFQVAGVRDGFENMDVILDAREFHSRSFRDGWRDTEVGKRIEANNERVRSWHEQERAEKRKQSE